MESQLKTTAAPAGWPRKVQSASRRTNAAATDHRGATSSIPKRFFWLLDSLAVVAGFVIGWAALPLLQYLFVVSGALPPWLLIAIGVPDPIDIGLLRWQESLWPVLLMVPTVLFSMELLGGYQPLRSQSRTRIVANSAFGPVLGLATVTMLLYALKISSASRLLIFSGTGYVAVALLTYRILLRTYFQRAAVSGKYAKRVLMIGDYGCVKRVADEIRRRSHENDCAVLGYLAPSPSTPNHVDPLLPCLGSAADLGRLLINEPVHEAIVVQTEVIDLGLPAVIESCDYFRVPIRIVPFALVSSELSDLQLETPSMTGFPEVVLSPRGLNSDAMFVKRLFDIVLSAGMLVILSPLFALVAIAIKLTTPKLPVFFPWRVIGYQGMPFTGYKFTTMIADAEQLRDSLGSQNEMSGPVFKIHDDPRITPLGRFLRKYSINELPQLWSVLKGDMSLVGPRPAFRHELERYDFWHKRKLSVKPGITCLWQVRGRNKVSRFDDWVAMDLEYIDGWSLWLDIKILGRTALAVVQGTGS